MHCPTWALRLRLHSLEAHFGNPYFAFRVRP
ncbi:MAG: CRISPR-associated protein Cas5 [Prevotellaceae bacterium]|nr:CRISPR-associated protein Cas5 [Prevotellaceae bacterium]